MAAPCISPVSPDVDELAGEVGSAVEGETGDVDFVDVLRGQPAHCVADQYQPVDCRQRDQQLSGRRAPELGRGQKHAYRERVTDQADWNDHCHRAEVHVKTGHHDPQCLVGRRRRREVCRHGQRFR